MKILRLRLLSTGEYRIVVHLDTTKVDAAGNPDPDYIFMANLPAKPEGMTHVEYLTQERPRVRQMCQRFLNHHDATEGPPLPGEGDPL
jgi:hypothetical protein